MATSSRRATRWCAKAPEPVRLLGPYDAKRAWRRRRFSSAVARRVRSTGVHRASDVACCSAHLVRSASDIERTTSFPDSICSRTCSNFASRASRSRSWRVFAMLDLTSGPWTGSPIGLFNES